MSMKKYKPLVTKEEIEQLAEYAWMYSSGHAINIANHYRAVLEERFSDCDPLFDYYCIINAVFEAGRVQGIREERQRRNKRRVSDAV